MVPLSVIFLLQVWFIRISSMWRQRERRRRTKRRREGPLAIVCTNTETQLR